MRHQATSAQSSGYGRGLREHSVQQFRDVGGRRRARSASDSQILAAKLELQGEIGISCTDEDQLCRGLLNPGAWFGLVQVSWFSGNAMHFSSHLARHWLKSTDQHDAHFTEFVSALCKSSLPSSFCCRQVFPDIHLMA